MSFFLEAKRQTDFPTNTNPSPFDYQTYTNRQHSKSYAPFGSTSRLDRGSKLKKNKQEKIQQRDIIDDEKVFVIQDQNFQLMEQDKMQSMFKSKSERFVAQNKVVPGPGAYELRSKYKSNQKKKGDISLQASVLGISRKINPPSIPTDSLGYKCDKDNNIEKVEPKPTRPPVPGSYDLRKQLLKQNGMTWVPGQTMSRKQDEQPLPGPGQYNFKESKVKAPTSCFRSEYDRFNPKKIKKTIQPGPSDYNPTQSRPLRQFSETHFNSKAMRFAPSKTSNVGPGSYFDNRSKSVKQFKQNHNLAESQVNFEPTRKTIFANASKNPGPGQYIVRDGMTFELQKALLRKHNLSQFPNERREVFGCKQIQEPGPGAYNPEKPHGTDKGNLGYKKVEVVNLKGDQIIESPSPFDYNCGNFTIAKKIQSQSKRLTLTDAKPFNTGSNRFPHYQTQQKVKYSNETDRKGTYETDTQSIDIDGTTRNMKFSEMKKTKKLVMTSVKVKVPFGTSTSKFVEAAHNELGPGYYETGNAWVKPTYSIKAKINGQN